MKRAAALTFALVLLLAAVASAKFEGSPYEPMRVVPRGSDNWHKGDALVLNRGTIRGAWDLNLGTPDYPHANLGSHGDLYIQPDIGNRVVIGDGLGYRHRLIVTGRDRRGRGYVHLYTRPSVLLRGKWRKVRVSWGAK